MASLGCSDEQDASLDQMHWLRLLYDLGAEMNTEDWQPIETAPKDGSNILIIAATAYSPQARVGWWAGDGWAFYSRPSKHSGGGVTRMIEVSHWRPLPDPPASPAPASGGE